jgi:hypothetical protein
VTVADEELTVPPATLTGVMFQLLLFSVAPMPPCALGQPAVAVGQVSTVLPTAVMSPRAVCAKRGANGVSAACAGAATRASARVAPSRRAEREMVKGVPMVA